MKGTVKIVSRRWYTFVLTREYTSSIRLFSLGGNVKVTGQMCTNPSLQLFSIEIKCTHNYTQFQLEAFPEQHCTLYITVHYTLLYIIQVIEAIDGGTPPNGPFISLATVTIKLLDENDNIPLFNQDVFEASVNNDDLVITVPKTYA